MNTQRNSLCSICGNRMSWEDKITGEIKWFPCEVDDDKLICVDCKKEIEKTK